MKMEKRLQEFLSDPNELMQKLEKGMKIKNKMD
jgi:hypothetical protein